MKFVKASFLLRALSLVTIFLLICAPLAHVAQTQQTTTQQPMGGVSTGAAATYTSKRTVGIVDATAPAVFEDVTEQTALKNFQHHAGGAAKDYIVETPSGGVA